MTSAEIIIRQMALGPMMNFVYIIGCAETRIAAVVDPAWDVPGILRTARDLDLQLGHILVTHAHPDHVNGLEELLETTDARIYLNAEEISYMREMAARYQVPIEFIDRRAGNIQSVSDNDEIRIGKVPVRVLHTPGHTPGSQCFLVEKNLFSGDTLFIDACGRVDFPGGDPEKMWWSLNRRLRSLEDEIILYPGHSYGDQATSTLGEQKRSNPYMQFAAVADFLHAMGPDR
ncbi:MAG: MBL fold metallo-hydrolase [Acidobacteriia bacterium]|nr:MBL fold metallo-hydrolase [Terriglobia bacterium]